MAKSINTVTLLGNLGQDPEMRYAANGNAIASASLATTRSWKDKATGQKQEQTEWHRIVAFGKTAELIGEYARKGNRLHVTGHLQTRKWEKDGEDRYTTEVVVDDFIILDKPANASGKGDNSNANSNANSTAASGANSKASSGAKPSQSSGGFDDFDDDIPF